MEEIQNSIAIEIMKPKYNLFDVVYYSGKLYHVSGVSAKIGYDLLLWEYSIAENANGGGLVNPIYWGRRTDISVISSVPEPLLSTENEYLDARRRELEMERAKVEKRLREIDSQLSQ